MDGPHQLLRTMLQKSMKSMNTIFFGILLVHVDAAGISGLVVQQIPQIMRHCSTSLIIQVLQKLNESIILQLLKMFFRDIVVQTTISVKL